MPIYRTLTSQPVHFSLTFQLRADLNLSNSCYCSILLPFHRANHFSMWLKKHENQTGYKNKFDWLYSKKILLFIGDGIKT